MDMDTDEYSGSADPLKTASSTVNNAMRSLESSLSGTHAMAGDDTGGQGFAKAYDSSAKDAVQAGCALGEALGKMGVLIKHAAHNHAAADAASSIKPKPAPAKPDASVEKVSPSTPPSAVGGTGDEPEWWHYVVSHLGGLLWPDADTGALRRAGTAWNDAASKVDQASSYVNESQGKAALAESPEKGATQNALHTLQGQINEISSAMRHLGQQCTDYAQRVDDTHKQTKEIGEELLKEVAVSSGVGIALTVMTAGISDAAAATADALEIANAAERIASFLRTLSEAADTASGVFRAQSGPLKYADKALNTFRTAEPKVAETGSAVTRTEKVAQDFPDSGETNLQHARPGGRESTGPSDGAGTGGGGGGKPDNVPPWAWNHNEVPTSGERAKLYEGYKPYGNLSKREFYEKYHPGDHWRFPGKPEDHGFENGERHPASLKPGHIIDRFGKNEGQFAAPNNTPFAERALPPSSIEHEYHRFEVMKELPSEVTEGRIAPGFEQPGGGIQYHFPRGMLEYVKSGHLRIIEGGAD